MNIEPGGTGHATLLGETAPLQGARWLGDAMTASLALQLPMRDAREHPHTATLKPQPSGERLRGQPTAFSGWFPYYYFALPSYVELRRE